MLYINVYIYVYSQFPSQTRKKRPWGKVKMYIQKGGGGHKKKWTKTFTEIDLKEDQLLAHIQKITSLAAKCRS